MEKQFLKTAFSTLIFSVLWGDWGVNTQVGIGTTSSSEALYIETSTTSTAIDLHNTGTTLVPKINFQISATS